MSDERSQPDDRELEAYLDGRLDPVARRHFELTLPKRADRRRAIQLQQRIDFRLHEAFVVPPIPPMVWPDASSPAESASHTPQPEPSSNGHLNGKMNGHASAAKSSLRKSAKIQRTNWDWQVPVAWNGPTLLLISGLIGVLLAITWWVYRGPSKPPRQQSFSEVYQAVASQRVWIEVKPEDERYFVNTFKNRNRQALKVVNLPKDRSIRGLAFEPALSAGSTVISADVQGQPVAVVVDHRRWDHPEPIPRGLHVHRLEIGELVLYEVSPFDQPMVLPYLEATEPIEYCRPDGKPHPAHSAE